MIFTALLVLYLSTDLFLCEEQSFHNHRLYSVELNQNESAADELRKLRDVLNIDFWDEPSKNQEKVRFRVSPPHQSDMERYLNHSLLHFDIVTNDIQSWIERERIENNLTDDIFLSGRDVSGFRLDMYHSFDEISVFIDEVSRQYSNIAKTVEIGRTYENNAIRGLKIGAKSNGQKPVFWIDGGIHAREWVSPATTIYIIHKLVTSYDQNPEITQLVDKYDWLIIPVANPDGYKYTWQGSRLWRKNRSVSSKRPSGGQRPAPNPWAGSPWGQPQAQPQAQGDCRISTDVNRNFPVDFGGASTSNDPCSEIYHGESGFSELESRAIRKAVTENPVKIFLSLHSFSQMWMIPFGYKNSRSPHHNEIYSVLSKAVAAVQAKHGQSYKYGTIAATIYPAAGSSIDWAHEAAGVKYSFVTELRDTGTYGFMLPRTLIIPTAEETWEGVKVIAKEAKI